jgi:uncharacterized membrane protein
MFTPSVASPAAVRSTALGVGDPGRLLAQVSVLPEGFTLPSLVYVLPVLGALVVAAVTVVAVGPPVTDRTVLGVVPWVGVGAVAHVLYQLPAIPPVLRPLFGTAMVYPTTATVAALVWAGAHLLTEMRPRSAAEAGATDRTLGLVGGVVFVAAVAYAVARAPPGGLRPLVPVAAVGAAVVVAVLAWVLLSLRAAETAATTGLTGVVVLFGHALDGVSTAVGVDLLGVTERTPLSRAILEVGAALPTADAIGAGWLFVAVKLLLAGVVLVAFEEYVDEAPARGRLVLSGVAAVGLGPGVHNVVLFGVAGGV